jgi:type II secretory pathway component PulK
MTQDEFAQIESEISVSDQPKEGLVNINTASEAVLACIPGIGTEKAPTVAAYRRGNAAQLTSVAWLLQAIDETSALQAGPYITTRSYQFTADIAAVGHNGRGYQRVKFILDTSDGPPQIRYRQDLSHLGWALGRKNRQFLIAQNSIR